MKRLLTISLLLLGLNAYSQNYQIPAKSPRQTIQQEFSYGTVTLDYARPSVKERTIFGDLVPMDKIWRLGADEATTIQFQHDVLICGKRLKKGIYSLFAIPKKEQWTLIFNTNAKQWGAYQYDEKQDALRVETPAYTVNDKVETFTMQFADFANNSMNLAIRWDNTLVKLPIKVVDEAKTELIIEKIKEIKTLEK